jgi:outer membrane immunogenic protein
MKQLIRLTILFCSCAALALNVLGGTETYSGKEMKQVAPAPVPECNWTGFYLGINAGGNFGHGENKDLDGYNFPDKPWGYDTSGFLGGGQIGYNYQWNWLVLGIEGDIGYMDIRGGDHEPDNFFARNDTIGHSESDFYTTIRGRLGFAWNKFLFYGTGGGIGVNWDTRVTDTCDTGNCGLGLIDAGKEEFNWGWVAGGGIEYMLNCHWTIRGEYLRYELDNQHFDGLDTFNGVTYGWRADAEGNIFRGALNYKF